MKVASNITKMRDPCSCGDNDDDDDFDGKDGGSDYNDKDGDDGVDMNGKYTNTQKKQIYNSSM